MKHNFLIIISIFFAYISSAQDNYRTYANEMDEYFNTLIKNADEGEKIPGLKNYYRERTFWDSRINYDEKNPNGTKTTYYESLKTYPKNQSKSPSLYLWDHMGPYGLTAQGLQNYGFVNCILMDKNSPDLKTMYAGSIQSGLWKTIDKGTSWQCITDDILNYGIGVMGIDRASDGTLYFTTGGHNNQYGTGIYKSTTSGGTWTQVLEFAPNERLNGEDILVDPSDPNTVYALIDNDLYRTLDAGISWNIIFDHTQEEVFINNGTKTLVDIEINPNNSNEVIIVARMEKSLVANDISSSSIWRTSNAKASNYNSVNWQRIDGNLSLFSTHNQNQFVSRYALAKDPQSPNRILVAFHYDDLENATFSTSSSAPCTYKSGTYVYESVDFGATFNPVPVYYNNINSAGGNIAGLSYYKNEFELSTTNSKEMYLGGFRMQKLNSQSDNTYSSMGSHHVDVRSVKSYYNPSTHLNETMLGNDGGVSLSVNSGSFQNKNGVGLYITQFHGIGDCESKPSLIMGGTQDNNYFKFDNNKWTKHGGGDQYDFIINNDDPSQFYNQNQSWMTGPNGTFNKCSNNNYSRFVQYPSNFDRILIPDLGLYRTNDGLDTYENISNLTDPKLVHCVDICPADENTIWFAHRGPTWNNSVNTNKLYKTSNGGSSWTDMTPSLIPVGHSHNVIAWRAIHDILIHPRDPNTVWIALAGYSSDAQSPDLRINKTTNGGSTWTDITDNNGMPYIPVNVLKGYSINDQFHLLAGNDIGVYQLKEGESNWVLINENMNPTNVSVSDIEVNYRGQFIRIATYGRGIYQANIPCETVSGTLNINTNTTWASDMFMSKNVLVKTGNTLTINGHIHMSPSSKITVETGAKLYVDGGTISSSCNGTWKGIEVLGNPNKTQSSSYQGYVKVRNGATIENAEIAIESSNGGMIYAYDSDFINNRQSIVMKDYHYITFISQISRNNFEVNDNNLFATSGLYYYYGQLYFSNITRSPYIKGNTIKYEGENDLQVNGIYSGNSGLLLQKTYLDGLTYRNQLVNLYKGIYTTMSASNSAIQIYDTDFDNTVRAFYGNTVDNLLIKGGTFDLGNTNDPNSYGIFLYHCNAPNIKLNTFSNGARGIQIGYIGDEGEYQIYKNTFNNFTNDPTGYEASAFIASGAISTNNASQGLALKCNTFSNNHKSITVKNGAIKKDQGSWSTQQQDLSDPANNRFSNYCNNGGTPLDDAFYVESGSSLIYNYFHLGNNGSTYDVDFGTCRTQLKVSMYNSSTSYDDFNAICPDVPPIVIIPNPTPGFRSTASQTTVLEAIEVINELAVEEENQKIALQELIDNGNTELLLSDVNLANTNTYTELAENIGANEGYISDEVVTAFAETNLDRPVAKTIALAQNSPLPNNMRSKISEANLPEDLEAFLWNKQNGMSNREQKEMKISALKTRKHNLITDMVRHAITDSLNADSLLIITALEDLDDLWSKKQLLNYYKAKNNTLMALELITTLEQDAMSNNTENSSDIENYWAMHRLSVNLMCKSKAEQLELLQAEEAYLIEVYNSNTLASGLAYAFIQYLGTEVEAPVDLANSFPLPLEDRTEQVKFTTPNTIFDNKVFLEIYPNPVDQVLKIEYILPNNTENSLKIYDISGSIIQEEKINTEMGIKHINVSQLVSGVYILQIGNEKKEFIVK